MPFIDPPNLIKPYGMSKIAIPYQQPIRVVKNPYFHLISFALLNSLSSRRSLLKYFY
jgi:hypothetical protein